MMDKIPVYDKKQQIGFGYKSSDIIHHFGMSYLTIPLKEINTITLENLSSLLIEHLEKQNIEYNKDNIEIEISFNYKF